MPTTSSNGAAFASRLIAVAVAVAAAVVAFTPAGGRAADVEADRRKAICAPEIVQLGAAKQLLDACDASAREIKAREQACRAQASADAERIGACKTNVRNLETSRDALCRAVGELGRAVAEGEPPLAVGLEGCLPAQRQEQIAAELTAWRRVLPQLRALQQFASGERESLPPAGTVGPLPVERVVAELVASDRMRPPLLYRRLLTSALERVAPRFWVRLRSRGAAAVEAWFASRAKLDPDLVAEAHGGADSPPGPPGSAGPPLAAALKFVQTYTDLARCGRLSPHAHGCGRARQLQELLESSGPLVVERRIESIWASDCRAIGPGSILEWLQDFPSSQHVAEAQWAHVTESGFTKLETCFLGDTGATGSAAAWVSRRLPSPNVLTGPALARLSRVRQRFGELGDEELCGRAVRALQRMPQPTACELPPPVHQALATWMAREAAPDRPPATAALTACTELLNALWRGRAATIAASFARPPTSGELVNVSEGFAATSMSRLRALCDERRGSEAFPLAVGAIAGIATSLGERVDAAPWRVERSAGKPLEQIRFEAAARPAFWARNLLARARPCAALGLPAERCSACSGARRPTSFDCDLLLRLEQRWGRWQRVLWLSTGTVLAIVLLLAWGLRMWSAWRRFGSWSRNLGSHLESIGIGAGRGRLWWLAPSRLAWIEVALPSEPVWERWGTRAIVHRGEGGSRVLERDVNRAATRARASGVELAILAHDDGASPDLAAVRALLEWAGRGSGRAVQVLPMPVSRLQWLRNRSDLLDVVEQSSARGNPFELRGRVTSASQFFDRERLVSGLLADVQAGNWVFVGGLRRFGKSSLALEVARRLPGPSAYVDLAAYHHEIGYGEDAAATADSILLDASLRLHQSAVTRHGAGAVLPAPLPPGRRIAGAEIADWYRTFALACARGGGHRPEPLLLVFDELEQAIGVDPERLPRALDVVSVLLGRLRGALNDPAVGTTRAGVLLCGAMHPVVWAPLPSLAGQSVMGAFQTVFVPRLPQDAAWAMMRGLGARQGIRFTDQALEAIVEQGQGVPLLIRRLASSVLELYDPERARQGSLGAVEIGIEGASAAVRREEEDGSPLRVWIETEIGEPGSVAGALLRRLAAEGRMTTEQLRSAAVAEVRAQFGATGIDRMLPRDEQARRAAEAAAVMVRMLGETGLLVAEGNPTSPDAYALPDGLIRRILGAVSACPSARRAR